MSTSIMLAIDFGSQSCKVAIGNPSASKRIDELEISFVSPLLPTILSLGNNRQVESDTDVPTKIGFLKEMLSFVEGKIPEAGTTLTPLALCQTESGDLGLEVEGIDGMHVFPVIQLVTIFIRKIVDLVSSLAQGTVTQAVIAVPSWFTKVQQTAVIDSCKGAGLELVGIITDTAALHLNYGISHLETIGVESEHHVVFVDVGHTDTSVSVLTLSRGNTRTMAVASDINFGGSKVDLALLNLFLRYLPVVDTKPVLAECQRIKEALSLLLDLTDSVYYNSYDICINGGTLYQVVASLHCIADLVQEALAKAGITPAQVHRVELCGGSVYLLQIRDTVASIFPAGIPILGGSQSIAKGSLYACSTLSQPGYYSFNGDALSGVLSGASVQVWSADLGPTARLYPILPFFNLEKELSSCSLVPDIQVQNELNITPGNINWDEPLQIQQRVVNMTLDSSPDKAKQLNKLASLWATKYDSSNNVIDLSEACMAQTKAGLLSGGSPNQAEYLNNLGVLTHKLYDRQRNTELLNKAIEVLQVAQQLATGDNQARLKYLINLGRSLDALYTRTNKIEDLNHVIETQKTIVDLIPDDNVIKGGHLNMLGLLLESRFDRQADIAALNSGIMALEKAILLPLNGPLKAMCYFNLGVLLQKLYNKMQNASDLEQSILHQQKALDLTPDADPQKPMYLNHCGESLQTIFVKHWNIADLCKAIDYHQSAVDLTNDQHGSKAIYLNNLGKILGLYFTHQKSVPHLERAIIAQQKAVDLTSDYHSNKRMYLENLAFLFENRYSSLSNIQDLNEAILNRQKAEHMTPDFHPAKPKYLLKLASALHTRYSQCHKISDLDDAIALQQKIVNITSEEHKEHHTYLFDLGGLYHGRFKKLGQMTDLEKAIASYQKAISILESNDNNLPKYLNGLGAALHSHFIQSGNIANLETSVDYLKQAIAMIADDDSSRVSYMNNLAISLLSQYGTLGDVKYLNAAIQNQEKIISSTPDGHPQQASRLNNLGVSLRQLFEYEGKIDILQRAITTLKRAVSLSPDNSLNKAQYSMNLGISLVSCFEELGDVHDLDAAIIHQQWAVDLIKDIESEMAGFLTTLGNSLLVRYSHFGEIHDLNRAISYQKRAIKAVPSTYSELPLFLNNLGNSLIKLWRTKQDVKILEEAQSLYQKAVDITSDSHKNRATYLHNLGNSFSSYYELEEKLTYLDKAILYYKLGLDMLSSTDPRKLSNLTELGQSFRNRATLTTQESDLDKAIAYFKQALDLTPDGHVGRPKQLLLLGQSLESKYVLEKDQELLGQAFAMYTEASQYQLGLDSFQFRAALAWIKCASTYSDSSLIDAYSTALNILPQLAWHGLSVEAQFTRLIGARTIGSDAAAAAIQSGNLELALQSLEKGRGILWAYILQLRSPLTKLAEINPALAEKVQKCSQELNHQRAIGSELYSPGANQKNPMFFEKIFETQHQLAAQLNVLMKEVQMMPELKESFAQPQLSELQKTSSLGPVVILNISQLQCDALIIQLPDLPVKHLHLKDFSYQDAQNLDKILISLLISGWPVQRHGRPLQKQTSPAIDEKFRFILKELWIKVVKPVIDTLHLSAKNELASLPHIWWCPTGPLTFLPLHAAGIYATDSKGSSEILADYAVSSYTPNLRTLLAIVNKVHNSGPTNFRMLAVIQPGTPGQNRLPATERELSVIQKYVSGQALTVLNGAEATKENVKSKISDSSWIHLACHGMQDLNSPTDSGLILEDGKLHLLDIINSSLPHADFAYLSACQTASGDNIQPDEAIHLAGGLLLAGFTSVIATMWAVGDNDAPLVADDVYEHLFTDGQPNQSGRAYALHKAVQNLRLKYHNASFVSWVPFIHMGL